MVRAISLFSGIEALSVAARGLDWQVVAFAEIEPFPCALLDYYYKCGKPLRLPDPAEARTAKKAKQIRSLHRSIARIEWIGGGEATNFGDAAQLSGTELPEADWIVAGPPCPDYSVAGKRAGIHGEHGNMTLELLRIYNEYHACRPHTSTHLLFENVPGLLSDRGNAFGRILAELAGEDTALEPAGPRWTHAGFVSGPKRRIAWRVLDAQYFTLAQRRERLFLIASPGNGTDPAKILFEYDGMRGNPPARRRTTQDVAGTVEASSAQSRGAGINPGELVTCGTLTHGRNAAGSATQQNAHGGLLIPEARFACAEDVTQALTCGLGRGGPDDNKAQAGFYIVDRKADNSTAPMVTSHPYNGNISREDGLIATAFNGAQDPVVSGEISGPCGRNAGQDTCIAFTERTRSSGRTLETQENLAYALTNPGSGGRTHSRQVLDRFSAVRRLTPRECERLQGFPDDYTLIPYARKPAKRMDEDLIAYYMRGGRITFDECLRAAKDAPRYKAIGNSKPTTVIRWILLRIEYWYFKQQSYCPAWCPCLSSNIKMRHGTEICFETQMKYAVKYRAQEDVKKNYSVSQM